MHTVTLVEMSIISLYHDVYDRAPIMFIQISMNIHLIVLKIREYALRSFRKIHEYP